MLKFSQFIIENKKSPNLTINAEDHPDYKLRNASDLNVHSDLEVRQALFSDSTSMRILAKGDKIKPGELVGARLNLNVKKNTGVPVLTLHSATNKEGYKNNRGFYRGNARNYQHVTTLKNVYFNVDQKGRHKIISNEKEILPNGKERIKGKHPMASVDGNYVQTNNPNFNGVEARFNPMRDHLFVDTQGNAIKSAEHVTLHGDRVYMRGKITYYSKDNTPKKHLAGTDQEQPSATKFIS